jgi:subtilisin family serine protease
MPLLSIRRRLSKSRGPALVSLLGLLIFVAVAWPTPSRATLQTSNSIPSGDSKRANMEFVPGEILVRFRSESASARSSSLHSSLMLRGESAGIALQVEYFAGSELVEGLRLARVTPEKTLEALAALNARADVLYAEPNFLRHALKAPNDTRYPEMWNLKNTEQPSTPFGNPGRVGSDIHAEQAWDVTTGSKDVVVGIVDEGMDINHPDLKDNIWTNPAEIPGNGLDDDGNGLVDDVNGWDFAHDDNSVFDYTGGTIRPRKATAAT